MRIFHFPFSHLPRSAALITAPDGRCAVLLDCTVRTCYCVTSSTVVKSHHSVYPFQSLIPWRQYTLSNPGYKRYERLETDPFGFHRARHTPDGEPYHLILLDTEGIDAYDQTGQYSTQIFSMAVLLSSLFVYNQMGGIDEAALDRLSLVTEMTKRQNQTNYRRPDRAREVLPLLRLAFTGFLPGLFRRHGGNLPGGVLGTGVA